MKFVISTEKKQEGIELEMNVFREGVAVKYMGTEKRIN